MATKSTNLKKPAAVKRTVVKKTPVTIKKTTASGKAKPAPAKSPAAASKSKVVAKNKKDKPAKIKMVRDNFSMPQSDFDKLLELKKTCLAAGVKVKKSELLRAGLMSISKLSNAAMLAAVKQIATKK